ncbi:MAG TPA: Mur ligase family protein [Thermomicrobiales bacterium]|nr:Mur ligase family protein [Thermomicrobiales bacterium]
MEICEIRDLDGPNMFMLRPAIKLEVKAPGGEITVSHAALAFALPAEAAASTHTAPESADPVRFFTLLAECVNVIHDRCGQPRPEIESRRMEEPDHYALAFSWTHRRFAKGAGKLALTIVTGAEVDTDAEVERLKAILAGPAEPDDAPEMITNAKRRIPIIAITGTNGKTTTTRLIASIMRSTGKRVGLTTSSGVFIDRELVLPGDYTGPAGAQRVFAEADVDIAVLETARGGILLRGLGYEENDVSVVTNVSADHLGLHGIHSVEGLGEVKSLVAKVTKATGFAVLNADDPLVLGMRDGLRARPFLVTRQPIAAAVQEHIEEGGWALTIDHGQVHWWHDGASEVLTDLNDVPITFGGRAPHMVENALCASAACLGAGLDIDQVRTGLAAFRPTPADNRGRLNVYDLNGATIIIDFAHNEAGLRQLLSFAGHFRQTEGKLVAVIGTAGDREDSVFHAIGEIAASTADRVILKDSTKYLRGREPGDMLALMGEGVRRAGHDVPSETAPGEREAALHAFELVATGDVVAVMCIEDYDYLLGWLDEHGSPMS